MPEEIYEVVAQGARYWFLFLMALIAWRSYRWYRRDRRQRKKRLRLLPDAGFVGEMVVLEGGAALKPGTALPVPREGTLGLLRADRIPRIHALYVQKDQLLPFAYGAKGIGEIATIPTAPAVQNAYRAFDGKLRPDLPMVDTPYSRARRRG